jgi:hypothetical protein
MSPGVTWTFLVMPHVIQNGTFDGHVGPLTVRHMGPCVTILHNVSFTTWTLEENRFESLVVLWFRSVPVGDLPETQRLERWSDVV